MEDRCYLGVLYHMLKSVMICSVSNVKYVVNVLMCVLFVVFPFFSSFSCLHNLELIANYSYVTKWLCVILHTGGECHGTTTVGSAWSDRVG